MENNHILVSSTKKLAKVLLPNRFVHLEYAGRYEHSYHTDREFEAVGKNNVISPMRTSTQIGYTTMRLH